MKELIELYQENEKMLLQIKRQLELLKQSKSKEYFQLCNLQDNLNKKQQELFQKIKLGEQYSSCHHIWVYSSIEHDGHEGRKYEYSSCIKCGLREEATERKNYSLEYQMMNAFFSHHRNFHNYNGAIHTELLCELDLGRAIYSKIKEAHPNIDDKTAADYVAKSLYHIRNIKINEAREASRAKRLSLTPGFHEWFGHNVHY